MHHGKPHGADGRPLTRFPTVQKHRMFFGSLLPSASTLAPAPGPRSPVPDGASGARVGNGNRTSHHGKPQGIVEGSPLRALPQCKVRCRFPSSQPSRRLFRVPSSQAVPIPVSAYSRVLVVLEQDRTCSTLRVYIYIFGKPKSGCHLRKRRWHIWPHQHCSGKPNIYAELGRYLLSSPVSNKRERGANLHRFAGKRCKSAPPQVTMGI